MHSLIDSIKEKKEFSALNDEYVEEKIDAYFIENPKTKKKLEENKYHEKSKEYKQAVKDIRAQLREVYGVFQKANNTKRRKLLESYYKARGRGERLTAIDKLLQSHQSTKERKDHYQEIYKSYFRNNHAIKILDLGCGFNPLAQIWMPGDPIYDCCDISQEDMDVINEFFTEEHIQGEAFTCNLLKEEALELMQQTTADTILLFKVIDTLETQQRNITKKLITTLIANEHVKRIIASFPMKSIGGRVFRTGNKENWFTKYLQTQPITYTTQEIGDEEFYEILKK